MGTFFSFSLSPTATRKGEHLPRRSQPQSGGLVTDDHLTWIVTKHEQRRLLSIEVDVCLQKTMRLFSYF